MSSISSLSQNSSESHQQLSLVEEKSSNDVQKAKAILMECGPSGDSLFNHISSIISKVIDERPIGVVDYFEQFSERVRHETFKMNENLLEEGYKEPERLALAQKLLPQLIENFKLPVKSEEDVEIKEEPAENEPEVEEEEDEATFEISPVKDLYELQTYWGLLGIGFTSDEVFMLKQSLSKIERNPSYKSCRIWGKFFGLKNDYYVAECALSEDAVEERIDEIETEINNISLEPSTEQMEENIKSDAISVQSTTKSKSNESNLNVSDFQNETENYPSKWNFSMKVAESQYRPPVEIPAEEPGKGTNRHVYFVSTDLTDDWIELPSVTPHQINVSRRIKKYLTGNLNENISSYPAFPGSEQNYLRALIARISSSTSIAPRNFYTSDSFGSEDEDFDEDEDEDTSMENDKQIKANASYRPLPVSNLVKLDYWEHVKPEILMQGRVKFFDGNKISFIADEEDDEDDKSDVSSEKEDLQAINREVPVPLFASCSGDRKITEEIFPWKIQLSDVDDKLVLAESNIWPGAYAMAKERICDHIYIGYGHKYWPRNYVPPAIPQIASEFLLGPEVFECNDPTVEEEEIFAKKIGDEAVLSVDEMDEDDEA